LEVWRMQITSFIQIYSRILSFNYRIWRNAAPSWYEHQNLDKKVYRNYGNMCIACFS
jgi:hypothetical protein